MAKQVTSKDIQRLNKAHQDLTFTQLTVGAVRGSIWDIFQSNKKGPVCTEGF